jgi:drug/metabolite transporter (DMT)-like permease
MAGLTTASASNASLLNNFEIVATSLLALALFREKISPRLWVGILLITLSSILLSVEGADSLIPSRGSLLVLAATCCWGLENNCTRQISDKNTYEIVMIKGLCSGTGSLIIALVIGEGLPALLPLLGALLLGFVAYGLSIFFYIRAQFTLGAAKTSAYYAVAPFVGAALSFLFLREQLSTHYFSALVVMICGSALVVVDTLWTDHKAAANEI